MTLLLQRKLKIVSCNAPLRYKTISITPSLFSIGDVSCSYAVVVRTKASFEPYRSLLLAYMLSFGNANVGDLYVNRRVSENRPLYINKGFIHKSGGLR